MSIDKTIGESSHGKEQKDLPAWLDFVRGHVESLKFGTVQITVHDGHVVQVEKAEKLRLDRPS